jgi:hypothetical protein
MATLAARNCRVIRFSETATVVRICSVVSYSIELKGALALGADVDCSCCMVRGCVAEQGEVPRDMFLPPSHGTVVKADTLLDYMSRDLYSSFEA